jgi:hypothetical protein
LIRWLQTLDVELFHFINLRLLNPVFDAVMPLASCNLFFVRQLDRGAESIEPAPPDLEQAFKSVTAFGIRHVLCHGRVLRPLQLFACRSLR